MSKFLVVAHSSGEGGAESALRNLLIDLRSYGHEITVLLPADAGAFAEWCRSEQIDGLVLPMHQAIPAVSLALLHLSLQDLESIASQLSSKSYDTVITNTSVILQGAILAELLQLPHITWIHELVDDESEVRSRGIPSAAYLRLIGRSTDHLLCCSSAVEKKLKMSGVNTSSSVYYPFSPRFDADGNTRIYSGERVEILAIGVQSVRKNPIFALTVLQALRLRGVDAVLHVFGSQATQADRLAAAVNKRGLSDFVRMHGYVSNPYEEVSGKAINLISASSEPFGLTIPESLARGIPVISSKSGGPEELLDDKYLFDVDDLDACVRCIEKIVDNYEVESCLARDEFAVLNSKWGVVDRNSVINNALSQARYAYEATGGKNLKSYLYKFRDSITLSFLPRNEIYLNIATAAKISTEQVLHLIAAETESPGNAVMQDCIKYDVVPFASSMQCSQLYRDGIGFSIELAATYADEGRLLMASFILSRLIYEFQHKPLRILALGDGIGVDSMRISSMGFDVDYIDFDGSLTGRVAELNFKSFIKYAPSDVGKINIISDIKGAESYDAIICLEVIEHVEDPLAFLGMLSSNLSSNGLLFISECFDGVRNHWPTHIQKNEDCSGLLPLMAGYCGLIFEDCNTLPHAKPYVFRKQTAVDHEVGYRNLTKDKLIMRNILISQWSMLN